MVTRPAPGTIRILFVGDVVGQAAVEYLETNLGRLRARLHLDCVVVNGDNCDITGPSPMTGSGMLAESRDRLLSAGADLLTLGFHHWDAPEAANVNAHPRVLHAANSVKASGNGTATIDSAGGAVSVAVVATERAMPITEPPLDCVERLDLPGAKILHLLSSYIGDAHCFADYLDGRWTAVLGTYTHVPTDDLRILGGGTAVVGDVGYLGPAGGNGGFDPRPFRDQYRGLPWPDPGSLPYRFVEGPIVVGAVVLDVREHETAAIGRLRADETVTWTTAPPV